MVSTIFLTQCQINKLGACWNNVYRRIFAMKLWELVKEIQSLCGCLDLKHMLINVNLNFFRKGVDVCSVYVLFFLILSL